MNSRILIALAVICGCIGISLLSSACTTMAIGAAAEAVVEGTDYSQSVEWDLENWLDDYERDFETAAETASGALTSRIVGGIALIIAAGVLAIAASAQAAGVSMRAVIDSDYDRRSQPPDESGESDD